MCTNRTETIATQVPDAPLTPVRLPDGRHNPYAMRVYKPTQSSELSTPSSAAAPPPPTYTQPHFFSGGVPRQARRGWGGSRTAEVYSLHAESLSDVCEFVVVPRGLESVVVSEDPMALAVALRQSQKLPQPLFVGQLRFETTAAEVSWLLEHLAGVRPLKVEPRGPGCFVVVSRSECDADAVLQLNRRCLFDYHGVWVAKTDIAAAKMQHHVALLDPQLSRRTRLPRDTMVVERQRGSLNPLRQFQSNPSAELMESVMPKHHGDADRLAQMSSSSSTCSYSRSDCGDVIEGITI